MRRVGLFPAKTSRVVPPGVSNVPQLEKSSCFARSLIRFRAYFPEGIILLWGLTWDWLPSGVLGRGEVVDFAFSDVRVLDSRR